MEKKDKKETKKTHIQKLSPTKKGQTKATVQAMGCKPEGSL